MPEIPHRRVRVLRAHSSWEGPDLAELFAHRWLIWLLAGRDIRVRYRQTALGMLWVVIQPIAIAGVLALTIGRLAAGGASAYAAGVVAALVPWQAFAHAMVHTSSSLVDNERLVTRVWFPRLALPVASACSAVIDLALIATLAAATAPLWGGEYSWRLLLLPCMGALAILAALAVGLWLSAANVFWRDVRYALPFCAQIWLLATPVAWPPELLPRHLSLLAALNPAAGPVLGFRWALLPGGSAFPADLIGISAAVTLLLLVGGAWLFRRLEPHFADAI
jgi:lipopolysaccharide transport system permease protein